MNQKNHFTYAYLIILIYFFIPKISHSSSEVSPSSLNKDKDKKASLSYSNNSKSPFIAGSLSMIWSGGGQFYLSQNVKGSLYSINNFILTRHRLGLLNKQTSLSRLLDIASRNFFDGLQVYEAYTDSFKYWEGEEMLKVPRFSISQLMKAPFKLEIYNRWMVLTPLVIPSIYLASQFSSANKNISFEKAAVNIPTIFITSYLIAIGEEAMFRGFQQPLFSQITGSKTIGNILQSVSFGTCHTTWIYCDSPYITGHLVTQLTKYKRSYDPTETFRSKSNKKNFLATSMIGLYTGYLQQKSNLKHSIALHFLWDALLFTADYLRTGEAPPLYIKFGTKF